jgi:integrase
MYATLRALCAGAVDDGVFKANPLSGLGRKLKLSVTPKARQQAVLKKAMTREQFSRFLAAAWRLAPRLAVLFLLMQRAGLRIGEALALRWDDLDLEQRKLQVGRTLTDDGRRVGLPKTDASFGTVRLSQQAVAALRRLELERKEEKLRKGWKTLPPWVFCATDAGHLLPEDYLADDGRVRGVLDPHNVRREFRKLLQALLQADHAAGKAPEVCFPLHFTPHSLRHTCASILLSEGKPITFVKEQLRHEDIALTVNTYGAWLPSTDTTAIDCLDDSSGQEVATQ